MECYCRIDDWVMVSAVYYRKGCSVKLGVDVVPFVCVCVFFFPMGGHVKDFFFLNNFIRWSIFHVFLFVVIV